MKDKNKQLSKIAQEKSYEVEFQVSQRMVGRFAQLTGDHSSLHIDQGFARRSAFRENVVHGMLPVLFIATLPFHRGKEFVYFSKISTRFLRPIFVADRLKITIRLLERDEVQRLRQAEFVICSTKSNTVFTTGLLTLKYAAAAKAQKKTHGANKIRKSNTLLVESLKEQDLGFDRIQVGQREEFQFLISHFCTDAIYQILKEGLLAKDKFPFCDAMTRCDLTSLLALSLFSTLVGIRMPGRHGTFMDFDASFLKPVELNEKYRLRADVSFKSESTATIVEDVSISQSEDEEKSWMTGKVKARVNPPSIKMPSVIALKKDELDLRLKGKIVLVTGASRGIGEVTAKLFSLHGAKVVVNYFKGQEDAERVVKEIKNAGGRAFSCQADVSNEDDVKKMVKMIADTCGTVDILVNNAVGDALETGFSELNWAEIQKSLNVIVKGAFHCAQAVIPFMEKQGAGKIINISTIYTENPPVKQSKYVIAKSALVGLSRSLAVELAPKGIQVNMVVPSMVETDLSLGVSKMVVNGIIQKTPMKRLATPVDVARAVVFLASSLSSYTTGQKIMVTGGSPPFL